ncbi:MAG: type III secretion system chaperone [Endozoicomonadaceae bacterium]|nr:type III secretion system chaperone [Endozoicomonadaceae bacterium]
MSHRSNVEGNLKRFAEGIGLGELNLNEHNACGLCFDDTLIVNIEYLEDDDALVFVASSHTIESHLSAAEKISLLEKALFINLQHHSMQGSYMALNHDKSEVLIIRSMTASLDYGVFESNLERFVNTLEWITAELKGETVSTNNPVAREAAENEEKMKNKSQNNDHTPPDNLGMMV